MEKYFNFNNEQDLTPLDVNPETGVVTFELENETATFDSINEFAEFYATARNVKHDNLKNWTLITDGDTYSYILRAGTAGLDVDELADMGRALRIAGLSPDEIGRAMAAAQSEQRHVVTVEREQSKKQLYVDRAIDAFKNQQEDGYLFLAYNVSNLDELKQAILADDAVFSDMGDDLDEYDEYDEYDEDDEDNYREKSYGLEDNLYDNLSEKIQSEKDVLREKYQGIAPFIALMIEQNMASDEDLESACVAYKKAIHAALVAGRHVPVTVVTHADDGDIIVTHTFNNQVDINTELFDFYVYEHRFVIYERVNNQAVNENPQDDLDDLDDLPNLNDLLIAPPDEQLDDQLGDE